jgi:hypothetical protein
MGTFEEKCMKKWLGYLCVTASVLIAQLHANGQYKSATNIFVQAGFALPMPGGANMANYYRTGWGGEVHMVTSLSKRTKLTRFSFLAKSGVFGFGGKSWWGFGNNGTYNEYKSDPITVIPLHGGLRWEFGNTKESPIGFYIAQDWGLTYIAGPTRGARYGHTLNLGFILGRLDLAMGYDVWKSSSGVKYDYFTLRTGVMF